MAEAPVESLRKILELERARGFADTAVIGGLDTFLRRLVKANRSTAGARRLATAVGADRRSLAGSGLSASRPSTQRRRALGVRPA